MSKIGAYVIDILNKHPEIDIEDNSHEKPIYRINSEAEHSKRNITDSNTSRGCNRSDYTDSSNINIAIAAIRLSTGLSNSNGATVSITGEILTQGMTVSTCPHLEHIFTPPDGKPFPIIKRWLQDLPRLPENFALGSWRNDADEIYLDVVEVFEDKDYQHAFDCGLVYNQEAIYSLTHKETIWLT